MLCGGSKLDKVKAAFRLFDFDGSGYIEREELELYMTSVFKVLMGTAHAETRTSASPEELAKATAFQCFREADLNGDGCVCCVVVVAPVGAVCHPLLLLLLLLSCFCISAA